MFPTGNVCPPTCSVTGYFDVSQALAANLPFTQITPVSFSITSGLTTLVNADPGNFSLYVSTDASGTIDFWTWEVIGPAGSPTSRIVTQNDVSGPTFSFDNIRVGTNPPPFVGPVIAEVFGDPGTWVSAASTATPEPSAFLLFGFGLLSLRVLRKS
jgi:hypothetical protein